MLNAKLSCVCKAKVHVKEQNMKLECIHTNNSSVQIDLGHECYYK